MLPCGCSFMLPCGCAYCVLSRREVPYSPFGIVSWNSAVFLSIGYTSFCL